MAKPRYKPFQIIEALDKAGGFLSQAAIALSCDRHTIQKYIKKHKIIATALSDIKDKHLDFAESKLIKAIGAGESWAICFYLKCQGKDRGYVERQEIKADVDVRQEGTGVVAFPSLPDNEKSN